MRTSHRFLLKPARLSALLLALCAALALGVSEVDAKKGGKPGGGGGKPGGGGGGGAQVIGVPGATTPERYHLSELNLSGDLEVVGPVVMVVDNDISLGNHTIQITGDGSMELYVGGNVSVGGNPDSGFNNTNVPSKLIVYGTHPHKNDNESPDYTISLNGNGAFTGVLYAPNADYRKNGGGNAGESKGSVVAMDITFNGSPGPFHFDEALEDLVAPFGGYTLSTYRLKQPGDLAPSDGAVEVLGRSDYESLFASLFDE